MAILLDMTRAHVPVLAGELIDLLDPAPGETAVDCTFGAGGHARLVADRHRPDRHARLHRPRPGRRGALRGARRRGACETRFLRMDYADGLELLAEEGIAADLVYLDLGISSMQVDARERGFSYSYDAPLDMRMDPDQELDAREIVNTWDERRLAQLFRRYGEEPYARRIAREIVAPRAAPRSRPPASWSRRSRPPCPPPSGAPSAAAIPPSATSRRSASRSTTSWTRSTARCPPAWDVLRQDGRLAAISFHSLEDRRVKRFLADRARGCICPPDLPVCGCGREPEAELLTRRAVAPTPGEVAAQPALEVGPPARGPQDRSPRLMARGAAAPARTDRGPAAPTSSTRPPARPPSAACRARRRRARAPPRPRRRARPARARPPRRPARPRPASAPATRPRAATPLPPARRSRSAWRAHRSSPPCAGARAGSSMRCWRGSGWIVLVGALLVGRRVLQRRPAGAEPRHRADHGEGAPTSSARTRGCASRSRGSARPSGSRPPRPPSGLVAAGAPATSRYLSANPSVDARRAAAADRRAGAGALIAPPAPIERPRRDHSPSSPEPTPGRRPPTTTAGAPGRRRQTTAHRARPPHRQPRQPPAGRDTPTTGTSAPASVRLSSAGSGCSSPSSCPPGRRSPCGRSGSAPSRAAP